MEGAMTLHKATRTRSRAFSQPDVRRAEIVMTRRQIAWACALVVATATAIALDAHFVAVVFATTTTAVLFLSVGYKALLVRSSVRQIRQHSRARQAPRLSDDALPRYTVLVPLYHEAEMLGRLIRHLSRLDYPTDRYEVLFLLEEDDAETRAAYRRHQVPANFRAVIVPVGTPRTKPRACNVGLSVATGDLLVIYDAEDRPDASQLRHAASEFAVAAADVVCLQARLDYHNHDHNLLARFFTVEYNFWFDLLLPGLAACDGPIPLGGTSNHFRTQVLRALGGWDPYNVTEDADLGVRLWVAGWRTMILDSTTLEEACASVRPWIRQRTRWVKGYIQTWLVHTRGPAVRRRGGIRGTTAMHLLLGGTPLTNLLYPVYGGLFIYYMCTRAEWVLRLFPRYVLYLSVIGFAASVLLFVYLHLAAVQHRQRWHLLGAALLSPIYWLMASAATYRAVAQLVRRAHVWEKTPHGLSGDESDPAAFGPYEGADAMTTSAV
jgi:cellulose synthase/poly-beta-1,6-N-acetylglucosamine synthase-like glycosyltransferase